MKNLNATAELLTRLRAETIPLFTPKRGKFTDPEADWHAEMFLRDPELYVLAALTDGSTVGQRARVAKTALAASWAGLLLAQKAQTRSALELVLTLLPEADALQVFLALRKERANHPHVKRLVTGYLLNHPDAESLFSTRRDVVTDVLEHALGKNVLRACVRLAGSETRTADESVYLRRSALRFARSANRAARLLAGLASASTVPFSASASVVREALSWKPERPASVSAETRGVVTGALTALYRQAPETGLRERFGDGLARLTARLPKYDGTVALVFDASASLKGYGDREFCALASASALKLGLEKVVSDLRVFPVGGEGVPGGLPDPKGPTDLAGAVVDALWESPDLILVVTDGYENRDGGDLARVAATLERNGICTPIAVVLPTFTAADDLSGRVPVPQWPTLAFWHEDELPELLLLALAHADQGAETARAFLRARLAWMREELVRWN